MLPSRCDRTRALLSQRLDTGITEVERRQVARHTAQCAGCRAFEAQTRWITDELRAAPPAQLTRPVSIASFRARRAWRRAAGNVASAAALLVVVVGGYAVGTSTSVEGPNALQSSTAAGQANDAVSGDALRALRADALRAGELPILPETDPPRSVKPALPAVEA